MIRKLRYLFTATFSNLWRNATLTIAAILTVMISLVLFGTSLMVRYAVDNATARWQGGIEFVVWMNADASPQQDAAIRETLDESPQIKDWTYVDQEAAYQEFLELFEDNPELRENVDPSILPPSYRVVPTDPDADVVAELADQFRTRAGVRSVALPTEVIKEVQRTGDIISTRTLLFSLILVVAALLLILNTVLIAIGARRREIEVMKLVGATNWFIRLPFMFEGVVCGLLGGALSIPAVWWIRRSIIEEISSSEAINLLTGFRVADSEFQFIAIVLVGLGCAVATFGSVLAVSLHLDV